jgi:hypothetical protein
VTWSRTADGKSTCDVHGGEPFEPHKGGACADCRAAGPKAVAPPAGEWAQLGDEAKRRGLPDILGYEQEFVALGKAAKDAFAEADDPKDKGTFLSAAIKSYRAALEVARYRDDWARIEYREQLQKLGRNGSGKKVKEGN